MKELEAAMGGAKGGHAAGGHERKTVPKRGNSADRRQEGLDDDAEDDIAMGFPASSFAGLGNPKTAFDAISRRSTAMSNDGGLTEHGTPGQGGTPGAKKPARAGSGKLHR